MFQLENSETITQALWLFFGIGAVNFVFTFPAFFWIEKVGRRGLILWTFPIMFVLLLVVDLLYYDYEVWINKAYQSPAQAAIVFLFLFVVVYSPGLGPVPFTYSAEVFQLSHREVGMGWAVAVVLERGPYFETMLTFKCRSTTPSAHFFCGHSPPCTKDSAPTARSCFT